MEVPPTRKGIWDALRGSIAGTIDDWRRFHGEPPPALYHYTTGVGLHGILASNTLWATNIEYLNDASELNYAFDLFRNAVGEQRAGNENEIVRHFLDLCTRTHAPLVPGLFAVYVTCFCEEGDLLSQWRAYGGQGGYAIGLEVFHLRDMARGPVLRNRQEILFELRRVVYDRAQQEGLLRAVLAPACALLDDIVKEEGEVVGRRVVPYFCEYVRDVTLEFLYTFKSSAFSEEKEWRLVSLVNAWLLPTPRLMFRVKNGMLIPYVELAVHARAGLTTGRIPISGVIYGPNLMPELTRRSLEMALRQHGYMHAEVTGTEIPLRP